MFCIALGAAVILLLAVIAEPERWPARLASFLRETHVHHG